jgi:nitrite reductase (NADH) small subunit
VAHRVLVCRVEEVPEGRGLALEVEGLCIAVLNDRGTIQVLSGRCPHSGGLLGYGWIEEGEVVCPLHRWRFQLASGRCSTDRGQSVHRFACEVHEGEVWVVL